MRDLMDDLKWSNPTPIAKEWLERAIAAERENKIYLKIIDEQKETIVGCNRVYKELQDRSAALREENDLQRHSIQQLSAQVVKLMNLLKNIYAVCIPFTNTSDLAKEVIPACIEALNAPVPSAEIMERMAKLEAVATVAGAISSGCYDANIWDKLKQALAEMEGGHR